MPGVRALLRQPGLGLKFSRSIHSAFISRALSLDQILGRFPLKEASSFKADSACVRMTSHILDHGMRCSGRDHIVRDLGSRGWEIVDGNPGNSTGLFLPSS
jgi:hypothetical protein